MQRDEKSLLDILNSARLALDYLGGQDIVIHKYDDVDLLAVWDTVMNDLPGLIREIEPLVPPDTE